MGTLAVRLTLPLAGCVEDLHLLVSAPCRAHQKDAPRDEARRRTGARSALNLTLDNLGQAWVFPQGGEGVVLVDPGEILEAVFLGALEVFEGALEVSSLGVGAGNGEGDAGTLLGGADVSHHSFGVAGEDVGIELKGTRILGHGSVHFTQP